MKFPGLDLLPAYCLWTLAIYGTLFVGLLIWHFAVKLLRSHRTMLAEPSVPHKISVEHVERVEHKPNAEPDEDEPVPAPAANVCTCGKPFGTPDLVELVDNVSSLIYNCKGCKKRNVVPA